MDRPYPAPADGSALPLPPLRSQARPDDRGNLDYVGDLYRSGETLDALVARISAHLASRFLGVTFALRRRRFARGRGIGAEVLDASLDLSVEATCAAFLEQVQDEIDRFNVCRSNFYSDYYSTSFFAHAKVGAAYFAARAARRDLDHPVERKTTLAAFKRQIQIGDTLTMLHSSIGQRLVGVERRVVEARPSSLVLEGPSWLDYPAAVCFACDGRLVRIAIGHAEQPDAHLLYEWRRTGGERTGEETAVAE